MDQSNRSLQKKPVLFQKYRFLSNLATVKRLFLSKPETSVDLHKYYIRCELIDTFEDLYDTLQRITRAFLLAVVRDFFLIIYSLTVNGCI